jgi:hypothetical protein
MGLVAVFYGATPAGAVPVLVQSNSSAQASVASVNATFAAMPTAGNLLVVVCATGLSRTIAVPTGYSVAINETGTPSQAIFYKQAAGNEKTITCSFSSSSNDLIQIYEYSGLHGYMSLDAVNTVPSAGTGTTFSTGSVTTTHANDLIFASVIVDTGSTLGTWTNTFTKREVNGVTSGKASNRFYGGGADFVATAAGAYTTSVNSSNSTSGNWRGQIVAFRSLASPVFLGADIVDGSGNSVVSPSVSLSSLVAGFGCQTATGMLGTATQKIRVTNNTDNPSWSLGLAATGGTAAKFTSGSDTYSYNDPTSAGCSSGQLTVNVGSGTLVPVGSCPSTGVALGANTAFDQDDINASSVTLATGNSSAPIDCAWDITGIPLLQKIPAEQKAGAYSLSFTITVVAN